MLEISVERHDDYVLCRPAGELDAYTVAQFREALTELADESYVLSTCPTCRSWTRPA